MKPWQWYVLVGLTLLIFNPHLARAQDHAAGHDEFHPAYEKWMQPDHPYTSCCHAKRVNEEGDVEGDCYPTDFLPVLDPNGKFDYWMAKRDNGAWIAIPEGKVLREKNPDPSGVRGHLCESSGVVYCARPPAGVL